MASVKPGEYVGLSFTREYGVQPDYEEGKPEPTPVPLQLSVSVALLSIGSEPMALATDTTQLATDTTQLATDTVAVAQPGALSQPAQPGGGDTASLTVINYTGRPLTFTIHDTQYQLPDTDGRLAIDLPPGRYTYTAATPWAAANGELWLDGGQSLGMSVSTNLSGDRIDIYLE